MKQSELIDQLKKNLKPVRRLSSPLNRFTRWFFVALFCVFVPLSFLGIREDFVFKLNEPWYLIEVLLLIASAIASGYAAFVLSVPGLGETFKFRMAPFVPLGLWLTVLIGRCFTPANGLVNLKSFASPFASLGVFCFQDILIMSLVPGIILFIWISRGRTLHRKLSGLLSCLAIFSLAALGTQLSCHNDEPLHLLVWHFAPVLFFGVLGISLGAKVIGLRHLTSYR